MKHIFTTVELEEMERCKNRLCLSLLMMAAVCENFHSYLDAKFGHVEGS